MTDKELKSLGVTDIRKVSKRTIYKINDVEFVTGQALDYIPLRKEVLTLLKTKGFNQEDCYKIAVFLNLSAYNKAEPKVTTSRGAFTLKDLASYIAIKKSGIDASQNDITISRIAKCLSVECFVALEKMEKGTLKLMTQFNIDYVGSYCFF